MHIGITIHGAERLNQRYPIFTGQTIKQIRQHLDHLRKTALVIYQEPKNKTIIYIGSFYKMVLSADSKHNLVTFIA
jgi:hypothetical protein